jgi:hypothetical protein
MNFEEKLIRYIASKLIQRKYLSIKEEFPSARQLTFFINRVIEILKEKHGRLNHVRIHDDYGLVTPFVQQAVDELKII